MSQIPTSLAEVSDLDSAESLLAQTGLSPTGRRSKAALLVACAARHRSEGVPLSAPVIVAYCPGRLEVFGKHTDYAGGRSVIAAPELGIVTLAVPNSTAEMRWQSLQTGIPSAYALANPGPTPDSWARYPATACRRLANNAPFPLSGGSFVFASDLPIAAGMSSSSALLTSTLLVLHALNPSLQTAPWMHASWTRSESALYASCVENGSTFGPLVGDRGIGTFGGSEDHTAMLCAEAGTMAQVRFGPIHFERKLSLAPDWTFVVAQSGVAAEKAVGALEDYNRLSRLVSALLSIALAHLDEFLGFEEPLSRPLHLGDLLRANPNNEATLQGLLPTARHPEFAPGELAVRLEHFALESERWIPALPDRLETQTIEQVAELARLSTRAAWDRLGNQVPATIQLAAALLEEGAYAASPFGAGFGGSVWGLVPRSECAELVRAMERRRERTSYAGSTFGATQAIELGPSAWVSAPTFL